MYRKNLFIIPPAGGKTRYVVPEIIKTAKEEGKTIYWLTDDNNIEYCGLEKETILTIRVEEWKTYPFIEGHTYQIVCSSMEYQKEPLELLDSIVNNENSVIIIDPASFIIGHSINKYMCYTNAADIHLFYDDLAQAFCCISQNNERELEYKEKKFLDVCKKEYNTFEKNRIFWMEHMGVERIKRKKGDSPDTPATRPLPTYQPYEIFGCTLYPYKIGSMPGMTIEEMVEAIRTKI